MVNQFQKLAARTDLTEEERHRRWLIECAKIADKKHPKSHCPAGHPYDTENTYRDTSGGKRCRECHRLRMEVIRGRASLTSSE